jgi:TatD DNase family protein
METPQTPWIDTHCHLYVQEFDADRPAMIARAVEAGVGGFYLPNIDSGSLAAMNALAYAFPDLAFPMIGLHPCSVKENVEEELALVESELKTGHYHGVGETGIDLYWDTTFRAAQIEAFSRQIEWARAYDLPVIIHSRESQDLTIDLVREQQDGTLRGIFHCFSGTLEQALAIHELGFKIGIGGVVTYKKTDLPDVLPSVPRDMIVLETDAPYLAPVPFRGKRNESSYLPIVGRRVAECLGITPEDVARITSANSMQVFRKKP